MNTFTTVIYRPPDAPTESFKAALDLVQEKLNTLTSDNRTPDLYIMGDFNLPHIDWEYCNVLKKQTLSDQRACSYLLDFMNKNFLNQMIHSPTRNDSIIDLILTNKPQDVIETNLCETQLSDHRLVELLLGYNPIRPKQDVIQMVDENSFRAVDYHRSDYEAMNEALAAVNWSDLRGHCENDDDGSKFLELIRLTVLQITLLHSPSKGIMGAPPVHKNQQYRKKYALNRKKRKLNARISAINQRNPSSPAIAKLKNEVNLLAFEISQHVINQLNEREAKAVSTIKTNPRYFYSYAKRLAKVKSTVSPIRDGEGKLHVDPGEKAELLQAQYVKVFSDPVW